MTIDEFIEEWGTEPDQGNYVVQADQYEGDVFLHIVQCRRNMTQEVVIEKAHVTDEPIEKWLRKSVVIFLDQIGLSHEIHVPSLWRYGPASSQDELEHP
jgi:hypothetical protein